MPSRLRPKFEFMQDQWGLDSNPFPVSTINTSVVTINEEVFPEEYGEFRQKLIIDAMIAGRPLGFLWSVPTTPGGDDTGLGKTGTMRRVSWSMNEDWAYGLFSQRMRQRLGNSAAAVALYASFDRNKVTSLNAVLFQALVYAADPINGPGGRSIAQRLRDRIVERERLEPNDDAGVRNILERARSRLAPGSPALRAEALAALSAQDESGALLTETLAQVSHASRQRSGLDYFEAFFTLAHAAGVPHVFVFVDQVEDLANSTVPLNKRRKEVERIRDVAFENPMFAGKLHVVFTMHGRAQLAVQTMWREARLPRFDRTTVTEEYIVTLTGIQNDEQVGELLRTYLRVLRPERTDDISPFDNSALSALREARDGRVGPILELAQQVFEIAATRNKDTIDGALVRAVVDGSGLQQDQLPARRVAGGRDARVIDDVLS